MEEISINLAVRTVKSWSLIIALMICRSTQSHYVDRNARSDRRGVEVLAPLTKYLIKIYDRLCVGILGVSHSLEKTTRQVHNT